MKLALVAACLIGASAASLAQSIPPSSVEGRVVNAVTGEPVGAAAVTKRLSPAGPLRAAAPGSPPFEINTSVDAQGRFAFQRVVAGSYEITVQSSRFVKLAPGSPTQPLRFPIMVGENQQLKDFVVRLTPLSAISGRVLNPDGRPVPDVRVTASQWIYFSPFGLGRSLRSCGSAQTDARGEYSIASLAPGSYLISAEANSPGRSPVQNAEDVPTMVSVFFGDGQSLEKATPVVAAPGAEAREVDIKFAIVSGVRISGKVVDPGGSPDQPHRVLLTPRVSGAPTYIAPAVVAQDGSFAIHNAPAGSYVLQAERRRTAGNLPPGAMAELPIEVGDKDIDGLTIPLLPTADLRGSVKAEHPDACGLNSMAVELTPSNGHSFGSPTSARVGPNLTFTILSVAPLNYEIRIVNTRNCYVKSIAYGGREVHGSAVPVNGKGSLEIALGAPGAQVQVTVVDGQGKTLSQGTVVLAPMDGGAALAGYVQRDGSAYFGPLRPASYRVFAFEQRDLPQAQFSGFLAGFQGRGQTITLIEGDESEVRITAVSASETMDKALAAIPPEPPRMRGSLTGRLLDATNSSPISGAIVTLNCFSCPGPYSAPLPVGVRTDAGGRFMMTNLEPGEYTVVAKLQGYLPSADRQRGEWIIVGEGQKVEQFVLKLTRLAAP